MSIKSVKEFLEKYGKDSEFRLAIDNAPDNNAKRRLAKEAGFEFTIEEVKLFLKSQKQELDEDALDNVIGGSDSPENNFFKAFEVAF